MSAEQKRIVKKRIEKEEVFNNISIAIQENVDELVESCMEEVEMHASKFLQSIKADAKYVMGVEYKKKKQRIRAGTAEMLGQIAKLKKKHEHILKDVTSVDQEVD
jgi:hypothetical protein